MQEVNLDRFRRELETRFPHLSKRDITDKPTTIPDEDLLHWLLLVVETRKPHYVPTLTAEQMALRMAFYSGAAWVMAKAFSLSQKEKARDAVVTTAIPDR